MLYSIEHSTSRSRGIPLASFDLIGKFPRKPWGRFWLCQNLPDKNAKRRAKRGGFLIHSQTMSSSILAEKSKTFALEIIKLYQCLQWEKEFILSKQLLRSGTSIGANIREAISGQSKQDFYAKICIAFKEAHETSFWLELLAESTLTKTNIETCQALCTELIKMLASTKITTEQNLNYKK
jgi:four helix bundle protein